MSVTSALYTGVTGLLNNAEAMNVIGNNISNVNTIGFKQGRTLFSDLLSQNISNDSQIGKGVQLQTVQNVFTQGTTQNSENVTDLALQGNSFFALNVPTTAAGTVATVPETFLTRAGAFHVDTSRFLVNPDGYKVLDSTGAPIQFPATFSKVTNIDTRGTITYLENDGITQTAMANRIALVSPLDPTALSKVGGSLYQGTAATLPAAFSTANGTSDQVLSNTLEGSNVDMAGEFVKMITTQRAYSANSKTITTTDQMTQEVLQLIR